MTCNGLYVSSEVTYVTSKYKVIQICHVGYQTQRFDVFDWCKLFIDFWIDTEGEITWFTVLALLVLSFKFWLSTYVYTLRRHSKILPKLTPKVFDWCKLFIDLWIDTTYIYRKHSKPDGTNNTIWMDGNITLGSKCFRIQHKKIYMWQMWKRHT